MDKGSYESYDYPAANEPESDHDQFYIVQDNATFLINTTRQVQYVTQVQNDQNALEVTQPCTVYDVTPQQFLVDVDNTSELMTVSDQYVTDAQSNLFSNSYLLQPGSNAGPELIEQNIAESLDAVNEITKQSGACTEITLSDEQYQMLEQKGWLLLEIGDKIYVLNTLGLHDITSNGKLIEKLRNESQNNTSQNINIGTNHLENEAKTVLQTEVDSPSMSGQIEKSEKAVEEESTVNHNSIEECPVHIDSNELKEEKSVSYAKTDTVNEYCQEDQNQDTEINTRVLVIENENIRREGNMLKIKTKLSLKDFPDKLFLGKTRNGKRLVAKVLKQKAVVEDDKNLEINKDKPDENALMISLSAPYNNSESNTAELEFNMLMQHLFRIRVNSQPKCGADDLVTADSVIAQLLQIPAFKPSVIDNDLIITKVQQEIDSTGKIFTKVLTAIVTGRVSQIGDQWRFIHLPHMFQKMISDTEELLAKYKKIGTANGVVIKDDYSVLHVQIAEAKEVVTGTVRISVTVNKRNIPLHLIMSRHQLQPNKIKMYACSVCAAVFGTELELKDHQADHSLEAEDMLTMDIDQTSNERDFSVIETEKGKSYSCLQCNATFNRLTTCKNHLKTHYNTTNPENKESAPDENNKAVYKCCMCTCTYFHPSTLSKHILSRHITKVSMLPESKHSQ